jgi:hypothetical protein
MKHILDWIPPQFRLQAFLNALFLSITLLFGFQVLDAPLRNPVAPTGIVSLELAWTPGEAEAIITSWDTRAGQFAAFGLGFDYFFMPVYALAIAAGSLLAAGRHPGRFARLGNWMGAAAMAAWVFDALENMGEGLQLFQGQYGWAPFVSTCATIKFILILAGILYGLIGWLWPKAKPQMNMDEHG